MSLQLDLVAADHTLRSIYYDAKSEDPDPHWEDLVRDVWNFRSKTYVPALGTAMLAKVINPQSDVFSIKVEEGNPNSFSLRSLGHEVLVPLAIELGFSIRNTGREPLNNQPFFRYNNVREIERVRNSHDLEKYLEILTELDHASPADARAALVAYLFFARSVFAEVQELVAGGGLEDAARIVGAIEELQGIPGFGPYLTQALGAALMRQFYPVVHSRRLNDPSNDFPGDAQGANAEEIVSASLEARFKSVSVSDTKTFVASCARSHINRAIILILGHKAPESAPLQAWAWAEHRVVLTILPSAQDAVFSTLAWAPEAPQGVLKHFAADLARELAALGAPEEGIRRANELLTAHEE